MSSRFKVHRGLSWLRERWRLLHGGGDIVRERGSCGIWSHWVDVGLADLEAIICRHDALLQEGHWLKKDVKRRITQVNHHGRLYVVKDYLRVFPLLSNSPDIRGWLCGNRLQGAVRCLGWCRHREGRGYLVMEYAGETSLHLPGKDYDLELLLSLFEEAGRMMCELHCIGVYHADLKPSNFVVSGVSKGDDANVTLIDCDDVRVPFRFGERHRLKNLAQLIGGLSCGIDNASHRVQLAEAIMRGYGGCDCFDVRGFLRLNGDAFRRLVSRLYSEHAGQLHFLDSLLCDIAAE